MTVAAFRQAAQQALRLERVASEQRVYLQQRDGSIVEFYADMFLVGLVFAKELELANLILDVFDNGKVPVVELTSEDGDYRVWSARIAPLSKGGVA